MVCRSTFGNSAITSWATQHSGLREVQVLSLFHEVRNDVPRDTPAPSREEYHDFLMSVRSQVLADPDLTPRRAASIARRLEDGMAQAPDGRTYYAWRTIAERATRARAAMDAHFREVAYRHGQTPEAIEQAFNHVADLNRDAGRNAPSAPAVVAFDDTNIPHDRATRYALMCVYSAGAAVAGDNAGEQLRANALTRAVEDAAGAQSTCPDCGQFIGEVGHACPNTAAVVPGLRESLARIHDDRNGLGGYVTTDGTRFTARVEALRHERQLIMAETAGQPDPDAYFGLRQAREQVRRNAHGHYVTSDGRSFATRQITAIHHERELGAGYQQVPFGTLASVEDEVAAGHEVHLDNNLWTDVRGNRFTDRAEAVRSSAYLLSDEAAADDAADAAQNCPHCGQFATAGHSCPNGADDDALAHDATLAALRERLTGEPATPATRGMSNGEAIAAMRERLAGTAGNGVPGQRCDNCGEFTGPRHVCAENADGEPRTTYDENGVATHPTWEESVSTGAPEPVTVTAAVDRPAAPASEPRGTFRVRTARRNYPSGEGVNVNMVNLSQARADLRRADLGTPVDLGEVNVTVPETLTNRFGHTRTIQRPVTGSLTAQATSARSRRGVDRIQVSADNMGTESRTLQCPCPAYQANYSCEHTRQAVEHVQALLNDRDAVAIAPQAAVDEARAELHAEFQDSLASQEQARTDFAATDSGVSYTEDMAAFQADWDAAKARIESGDTTLTYMTENATGGLGARVGGRSFGIEIEVDFPDDMTYTAKNRVAREIYEAGLSQGPQVRGWHWVGRQGGGYTDAPNNWAVEFDRSVDDVGGQRGCEIVSPILYDEPHTWENLAKVCEIIQRNGGKATPRTGLHINVGAADYDHTVENHNRLLNLSTSYEDVLVRVSHNPDAGRQHRGRAFCTTSQIPADGYRGIREAQMYNSHRSMVNLDHVPNEDQRVTSSTRVEVRIFDGTVDPGRMQADVKVALGLVNAATRGVEPAQAAEPAGTHRGRNTGTNGRMRRLSGDAWTSDTASFRAFADSIFSRAEDKAQLVQAFAASRWQAR